MLKKILAMLTALMMFYGAGPSVRSPSEAKEPIVREIGSGVYLFDDYSVSSAYLIVGSQRCVVIDTGIGFADFRSRIERYTQGKPVAAALTHGHIDHAGAARQFETVYMHSGDLSLKYQQYLPFRFLYTLFGLTPKLTQYGVSAFDISDKNNVASQTVALEDGGVIDLGDRTLTFYFTPGHTQGSGCYLDSKTNILFAGDMTFSSVMLIFPESASVETYRESLLKIYDLESAAAAVHTGHSKAAQDPAVTLKLLDMTQQLLDESRSNALFPVIKKFDAPAQFADGSQHNVTLRYLTSRIFDKPEN